MSAMGIYKQDLCWYIYLYTFISLAAKQNGLFLDKMLSEQYHSYKSDSTIYYKYNL